MCVPNDVQYTEIVTRVEKHIFRQTKLLDITWNEFDRH